MQQLKPFQQLLVCATLLFMGSVSAAAELRVVTHASFDLPKPLIERFEQESGVSLRVVKAGDTGEMVNKLILSKGSPIGDVVYGIDNSLLGRARSAGILDALPASLRGLPVAEDMGAEGIALSGAQDWLPIDWGYVTLNADKSWFAKHSMDLPKTLDDLAKAEYAKLLVVQNPATSSPGMAFLLATASAKGESVWDWWAQLRQGGVKVANSWSDAYYKDFSLNGGDRPLVVSYASSPAAEVFYSDPKKVESPTANVFLPGGVFLQVEGVARLKGGQQPEAAAQFMRFMRSVEVQQALQTTMWMWPVQPDVVMDPVMSHAGKLPPVAAQAAMGVDDIAASAEAWRRRFAQVVLR